MSWLSNYLLTLVILLKIGILSDFFHPRSGGIAVHIEQLSKYLKKRGHEPVIITTAGCDAGLEKYNRICVIRFPASVSKNLLFPNLKLERKIQYILDQLDFDLLNAHHAFSPMGIYTSKMGQILNIPSILTNHSIPMGFAYYKFIWARVAKLLSTYTILRSLSRYERVIAVSKIAAEFIRYFNKNRVTIIPNGVDLEEFKIKGYKEEFGLKEEDPLLIMVGRSTLKKGYEVGLLTLRWILKRFPRAKLFITGVNGVIRSYIYGLAKVFGVAKAVKIPGFLPREKLIKLYWASDVLLHFPYGGESFGIVLLEAMASETPIVATHGDGLQYILNGSGSGFVSYSYDPRKLANLVIKILESEELKRRLGRAGRKIAEYYSWNRIVDKVIAVYKEAIENYKQVRF